MNVKPGFWNCCTARPYAIVMFLDDNDQPVWHEACESCATSQGVTADRVRVIERPKGNRAERIALGHKHTLTVRRNAAGKWTLRYSTKRIECGTQTGTTVAFETAWEVWAQFAKVLAQITEWQRSDKDTTYDAVNTAPNFREAVIMLHNMNYRAATRFGVKPIAKEADYIIGTMNYGNVKTIELVNVGTAGGDAKLRLTMTAKGTIAWLASR